MTATTPNTVSSASPGARPHWFTAGLGPVLFAGAWLTALFFNGEWLPALAVSLLMLALWSAEVLGANLHAGFRPGDPFLPAAMALYLLWLGIAAAFSAIPYLSSLNLWWLGVLPGAFLISWLDPRREAFLDHTLALLKTAGVILAGVALWQHLITGEPPAGPFHTRNSLAALLALLAIPLWTDTLQGEGRTRLAAAAGLFLLLLTIGIIQSRGALLGLATGITLLIGLGFDRRAANRWRLPVTILVAAMFAAWAISLGQPASGSDLVQRMISLGNVEQAGRSRFLIWEPAWRLFLEHPLLGTGPGTYFMVIPPWLDAADRSAHFYVHNDYLQIALETGLPGLISLLLIGLAALRLLFTRLPLAPRGSADRLALVTPFAAVVAVAVHSLFTFNLYIVPTTLLAALLLARLHATAARLDGAPWRQSPLRHLRPALFRALQVVVVAAVAFHFVRLSLGDLALEEGRRLAAAGQADTAHRRLLDARRLSPAVDSPWFTDADLLRRSAQLLADRHELARPLLEEALETVEAAITRNPFRPQSHYIRGEILRQMNPDDPEAVAAWRTALARDPRYLPARNALVRHHLARQDRAGALARLREGLDYYYSPSADGFAEYLELAERLFRENGETTLADRLRRNRERLALMRRDGEGGAP